MGQQNILYRKQRSWRFIDALEHRQLLSAGLSVDGTFGAGGGYVGAVVQDLVPGGGISDDWPINIAVQADGKPVILSSQGGMTALLRYTSAGVLDSTYGSGGIVSGGFLSTFSPTCIALQADGKALVGGYIVGYRGSSETATAVFTRITTDGQLDSTFGSGGAIVQTTSSALPTSITYLPDGRIVAGGRSGGDGYTGWDAWATLWRFNSDGSADTTLNGTGVLRYNQNQYEQFISSINMLPDGFVASTANGTTRFDSNGARLWNASHSGPIALQSDKIIVAERQQGTGVLIWRYDLSGQVDATFGTSGSVSVTFDKKNEPSNIIVMPDGKILIGESTSNFLVGDSATDGALARLLPDGALDTTFGFAGKLRDPLVPSSSDDTISYIAIGPGGVLYALGGTQAKMAEDVGNINSSDNLIIRKFFLDAPIDVEPGGPYGPVPEGSALTVSDGGSSYAGGSITSYLWSTSGNGTFSQFSGPSGTLTMGDSPSALVNLTVTTNDGLISYGAVPVSLSDVPPSATFITPRLVAFGTSASLSASADDVVPEKLSVTLGFGDGSATSKQTSSQVTKHFQPTFTHTYATPGNYTVTVTATDDDGASNITTAPVQAVSILVNAFNDTYGNGFSGAAFGGVQVYIDANNNGQLDSGEPTQTTGSDGLAGFSGLANGTYRVRFVVPAGWNYTQPFSGYADLIVTSAAGATLKVGLTQLPVIAGFVWLDTNGNGVRDGSETGKPSLEVYIDNVDFESDPIETQTDSQGLYRLGIPGQADGDAVVARLYSFYSFAQTFPFQQAGRLIVLHAGQLTANQDFGYQNIAGKSISGTVFEDINGDGIANDSTSSTAPTTVFIDADADGVLDAVERQITVIYGAWSIGGLVAGTYPVRMVPPTGFAQTRPTPGQGYSATVTSASDVTGLGFGIHDIVAPTVISALFQANAPSRVSLAFSESVTGINNFTLVNLTTGQSTAATVTQGATDAFCYVSPASGPSFEDGNYRLSINAGLLRDKSGNSMPAYTFDFFVFGGDANGDRTVDGSDMVIFSNNWLGSGKTFSQGDFNYDGKVDARDLGIIATHWYQTLAPPPPPQTAPPIDSGTTLPAPILQPSGPPPPETPKTVYLSDLTPISVTNGYGQYEKDRSNGEAGSHDGHTITLNGKKYDKGLGVHAGSTQIYNLSGQYSQFLADVGVDDEVASKGSVVFQIYLDNVKVYDSKTMTGSSASKSISLDVTGKKQLKLLVTDAGNGKNFDHADWAAARLVASNSTLSTNSAPISTPSTESKKTANLIDGLTV